MATTVTLTPVTNLDYTTWAAVKTYLDISGTGDDALGALLVDVYYTHLTPPTTPHV